MKTGEASRGLPAAPRGPITDEGESLPRDRGVQEARERELPGIGVGFPGAIPGSSPHLTHAVPP